MIRVLPVVNAPVTVAVDGFGKRTNGIDSEGGDEVELLDLSPELVEHSGFVTALAERVARLAAVRHMSYTHLRRLDRPSEERLELVSDYMPGWRLSELLARSNALNIPLDITIVIGLLRQLLPAVALYGRNNRDAAIGTIGIERLIVTPQARLVIAEHAFGPAIEKLNLGRDRLWREYRVAMPPSAGLPRANQRADAHAIGLVALSLVLGRPLDPEEFPAQTQSLIEGATESRDGERAPLSSFFNSWLARALQVDVRTSYQTPSEAQLGFESVLASDRSYVTTPKKLEEWVAKIGGMIEAERRPPEPEPEPEPPPPPAVPEPVVVAAAPPVVAREITSESRLDEATEGREVGLQEAPLESPASENEPAVESIPVTPTVETTVPAPEPQGPEAPYAPEAPAATVSRLPLLAMGAVILVLIALVGWLLTRDTGAPRSGEGELVVTSRPPGATVSVDGKNSGVTPITLRLASGAHVLEVKMGNSEPRVIPLMIRAGVQTAQYVELQEPEPISPPKPPAEKTRKR